MGNVLHSIPLCSRGSSAAVTVEPLDLDKNNNSLNESAAVANSISSTTEATVVVHQPSQPALPPPEATSTPRPQSPTGLVNSQYSDNSSNCSHSSNVIIEDTFPIDSGLEDTEFEYSKGASISPNPLCISPVDNLLEDHFDDTLDDDVIDDGHEEIDLNDPVERPPEPTVPDERVASSSDEEPPNDNNLDEEEEDVEVEEDDDDHDEVPPTTTNTMTSKMTSTSAKDSETTRKISSLLSELVGDHPSGEVMANREIIR